jgi:pSer/pThr/pTyr-binding forkhead associated (FHA) protein
MAEITVFHNGKPGRIYRFNNNATIGRDPSNEIQIRDQRASRRHLVIEKLKSFYILKDQGSRNGTHVNGIKTRECELNSGDRIMVGNTSLVFSNDPLDTAQEVDTQESNSLEAGNCVEKIRFAGLKDLYRGITESKQKIGIIKQLTELLSYSAASRPIDSGHIIFQEIQEMLHRVFTIDRSYILLLQKGSPPLKPEAVRINRKAEPEPDFTSDMFQSVYSEGYSVLFSSSDLSTMYTEKTSTEICRTAMAVPIRYRTTIKGVIFVDCLGTERYCVTDLKILSVAGLVTGTSINTWQTYRTLQMRSLSYILALAGIAETAEILDKGTSVRLAARCLVLCEAMGLPEDQTETITVSAVLAAFMNLRKPNADITETLPEESWEPGANERDNSIFQMIKSLSGLDDISGIIKHRNDNYDGSGSPYSLKGNAIPLGSRILKAVFYLEYFGDEHSALSGNLKRAGGTILDPVIVKMLSHLTQSPEFFSTLPGLFRANQDDTDS